MTLAELIAHVGQENILVQRVDQSLVKISTNKKGVTRVTFETKEVAAGDFMFGAVPKTHGLIIWLPRELMPKA